MANIAYDVTVHHHGTVTMVEPLTDAAKEWVENNVELESWAWMGNAFAVHPRYVDNLLTGMHNDGLSVDGFTNDIN